MKQGLKTAIASMFHIIYIINCKQFQTNLMLILGSPLAVRFDMVAFGGLSSVWGQGLSNHRSHKCEVQRKANELAVASHDLI